MSNVRRASSYKSRTRESIAWKEPHRINPLPYLLTEPWFLFLKTSPWNLPDCFAVHRDFGRHPVVSQPATKILPVLFYFALSLTTPLLPKFHIVVSPFFSYQNQSKCAILQRSYGYVTKLKHFKTRSFELKTDSCCISAH